MAWKELISKYLPDLVANETGSPFSKPPEKQSIFYHSFKKDLDLTF
jgi:hypothetical protein